MKTKGWLGLRFSVLIIILTSALCICEVRANVVLEELFGFQLQGEHPQASLIQSSDGNFYGTTSEGGTAGYGTIFQITSTGALTILADFTYTNGATPFAALAQGLDGNFYGTTVFGGGVESGSTNGTVFQVTPSGTLKVLVNFGDVNGANPEAGLVRGSDGNFYGTTMLGGGDAASGQTNGTIFKMTLTGDLTTLARFDGTNGSGPATALVQGGDGSFYGTTAFGGASGQGTIYRMTPTGGLTSLVSFTNANGAYPLAGLIVGSDGNFYGMTKEGGATGFGTVFQMTPLGNLTTLVTFTNANGAFPMASLIQATDGNFYGTTASGGHANCGTVFQMTPVGILTTLVDFATANESDPEAALVQGTDGRFYGTTVSGGQGGFGTVYRVTLDPMILVQPVSRTNIAGSAASFTVLASGSLPLSYQWLKGTTPISGEISATLSLPKVAAGDAGAYSVVVNSGSSSMTSMAAALTVLTPPVITTQPHSSTNVIGSSATFSAVATGTAPLTYQWLGRGASLTNGGRISGATTTALNIGNVQPGDAGSYALLVTNMAGSTTSDVVTLSVTQAPIALVQQTSSITTGAQTLAATFPRSVSANNLIVVCVAGWPTLPATIPVTDTMSNTYSLANYAIDSWGAWSAIYYAANAKAGVTTVTFHAQGNPQISLIVAEFSNVATVGALDGAAGAVGRTAAGSSGNMTPTAPSDLIVGTGQHEGTTVTTAGAGFTMAVIATEDNDIHMPLALEYEILNGTQPVSATFNLATAYEWTVNGAIFKHTPVVLLLAVDTTKLADANVGVPYSLTLSAIGGVPPYSWAVTSGALPRGLSLSTLGVISGTPTDVGIYNFTVQVRDSIAATDARALSINVVSLPTITTSTLATGEVSVVYSQTLAAVGGSVPYAWFVSAGALPAGLSLSAGGVISGTPASAGTSSFTVRVQDANSAVATRALTLTVLALPAITTSVLPTGVINGLYSQALAASGGLSPYGWSLAAGNLPIGLSLSADGVISGTSTSTGTVSFTVQLRDANGVTATRGLSISIVSGPSITTTALASGEAGVSYSQTLAASGGAPPYAWSVSAGGLPGRLSLSAGGVISGTPTNAGSFNFTVQVRDANALTATAALTISVVAAPSISTASLVTGEVSVVYSQRLAAVGGVSPYSWSVSSGALPGGLSLSIDGLLSGLPANAGAFNFTARVQDANVAVATRAFTLRVLALPSIMTTSLSTGVVSTAYSQTLAATGGLVPYTWSVSAGALPGGLSLSAAGVISGIPNTAGVFSFTAQVLDSNGVTGTHAFGLTVVPQAPIALLQAASATTTSARTLSATLPSAVAASDLIVVSVSGRPRQPATSAVTDNRGNTYSRAGALEVDSSGTWSAIYYAANARAGSTSVTVHDTGIGRISVIVAEFSNVATAAPLDGAAGAIGTGTVPSSGTMTPSAAGDLVIGSGQHEGNTITSAGTGFTMVRIATEDNNTHVSLALEYQVLSDTSPTTGAFGLAAAFPWTMNGAMFKHK